MSDDKINKKSDKTKKFTKKKSKKLVLSEFDQMIVDATDEKLKEIVVKELEEQIASLIVRVNQMKSNKNDKEEEKVKETESDKKDKTSTKKNIVLKLRKFKKCLSDEVEIKKRVKLLKLKRRKLRKIVEKVQEKIKNLAKKKLRCFKCRKRGHTIADCTGAEADEAETGNEEETVKEEVSEVKTENEDGKKKIIIKTPKQVSVILCYNCGANDHSIHGCNMKVDYSNLPFAVCFICKNKGHLSSNCPTSDKGIYVRGGSCFVCGGKDHLAKNCPQKQIQVEENKNDQGLLRRKRNFSTTDNNSKDNEVDADRNIRNNDRNGRNNNFNKTMRGAGRNRVRGRGNFSNRSSFARPSSK